MELAQKCQSIFKSRPRLAGHDLFNVVDCPGNVCQRFGPIFGHQHIILDPDSAKGLCTEDKSVILPFSWRYIVLLPCSLQRLFQKYDSFVIKLRSLNSFAKNEVSFQLNELSILPAR